MISLDIQWMKTSAAQAIKKGKATDIITYINDEVLKELRECYSEYLEETTVSLAKALADINMKTGFQFVLIVDEWDCFFREDKDNKALLDEYVDFLRSLFKGQLADQFIKLAYITGILPIKKYGTQSALNNFRELTMVNPGGIADYIGFTEAEVRSLCQKHDLPFQEMQMWYDGYVLSQTGHVYSPNSVMETIDNGEFQNYWTQTETYESLKIYIEMDFDGLKQKIADMLAGERCPVVTRSFQNDMTSLKSSDDVLTLLIHLGYLAYDSKTKETFIPNEEVRDSFILSIMDGSWGEVYEAIKKSEALLKATLAMEADKVFIPKRTSAKPALVVELKWDQSAEGAIAQIKNRKYVDALKECKGDILLVGINYDKKSKEHKCLIEKLGR